MFLTTNLLNGVMFTLLSRKDYHKYSIDKKTIYVLPQVYFLLTGRSNVIKTIGNKGVSGETAWRGNDMHRATVWPLCRFPLET